MIIHRAGYNGRVLLVVILLLGAAPSAAPSQGAGERTLPSSGAPASGTACTGAAEAFGTGQIERAAELARACIQAGNAGGETYKLLALASFLLGRLDDYRSNMEKAVALDPRDASAHYHLGRFFYETKNFPEAEARFRTALAVDPDHYRAHYFTALCRQGSSDPKGAQAAFRASIAIIDRLKIRYGWPFADLGELLMQAGEYDQGLGWLYRAARNDPNLPYTHYCYARALMRRESTPEAEAQLQAAIKLDAGYTEAYYLLGRYYTNAGDPERARAAFARFDELRKNPAPSPFGLRR
jgi:tetratricopeptide (TPR) repeat protein